MKKVLTVLMSMCLLAATACQATTPTSSTDTSTAYTAGTYTGVAQGRNGEVKVEVTVSQDAITNVEVVEQQETEGIAEPALTDIPAQIVQYQSLKIDAVTGATITSNAVLDAAASALEQAGADVDALREKSFTVEAVEGATIEASYDVIVVGGGYSGLVSAVSAAEAGASVVLIEKQNALGGSSAMSGGGVKAAMKMDGDDYLQVAYDYWMDQQEQCDPVEGFPESEFVEAFLANSEDNLYWLEQHGYEYELTNTMGAELAFPTSGDTPGNGGTVIELLRQAAEKNGVVIETNVKGTEILMEDGAVVGLKATSGADTHIYHSPNVILATGGFPANPELIERFCGGGQNNFNGASAADTGDGILMAEAVGAALYEDGWFIGTKGTAVLEYDLNYPLNAFTWNPILYVNDQGKRFVNENDHYAAIYTEVVKGGYDYYYLVMDSASLSEENIATLEDGLVNYPEVTFKGDTIEAVSTAAGIDPEGLKATVEQYNTYQSNGVDTEFGKEAELCTPVETAPFYIVKVRPTHLGTMGGVQTNLNMECLDNEGNVIPGLYAVGECSNRPFYAEVYVSGTGLGVAVFGGRIAGEAAAARVSE